MKNHDNGANAGVTGAGVGTNSEKIYENVIGFNTDGDNTVITEHIRKIRKKYSTPLFAWVPKSEEEEAVAISQGFDTVIFEDYTPRG